MEKLEQDERRALEEARRRYQAHVQASMSTGPASQLDRQKVTPMMEYAKHIMAQVMGTRYTRQYAALQERLDAEGVDESQLHKRDGQPIDLPHIKDRLDRNGYDTLADFARDLDMAFENFAIYAELGFKQYEDSDDLERFAVAAASEASFDMWTTQSQSMTTEQKTKLSNALKKLGRRKCSEHFREPVDPVKDNVPNYHHIISMPMDLETISRKLEMDVYGSQRALLDDFNLMVSNCVFYNNMPDECDQPVVTHAYSMEEAFYDMLKIENPFKPLDPGRRKRKASAMRQ